MNRVQLWVLWAVGLLLSAVLLQVGILNPYLLARENDRSADALERQVEAARLEESESLLRARRTFSRADFNELQKSRTFSQRGDELERLAAFHRGKRDEAMVAINYYTGIALPVLILGGCAFVTAGHFKLRRKV